MTVRVVITGRGAVTALGHDIDNAWSALCQGAHGLTPLGPDLAETSSRWVGQIRDFDPSVAIPSRRSRRLMDRRTLLAAAASTQALREAGLLEVVRRKPSRCGIALAANHPLIDVAELEAALRRKAPPRNDAETLEFASALPPLGFVSRVINMAASQLATQFDLQGPSATPTGDGAAGAQALGIALRWVRAGAADAVLVGGVDARLDPFHLGVLARWPDMFASAPPGPSTGPFGAEGQGGYPGEAAACLVIESLDGAKKRGAVPIAEVLGYGAAASRGESSNSGPDSALIRATRVAVGGAGGPTRDRHLAVYAAGTGSPARDRAEAAALREVAAGSRVTASKGAWGNTLAASAPLDLILATQTLASGVVPPTAGVEELAVDCDLDLCRLGPVPGDYRRVLVQAIGFRGPRAAVILGGPP